MKTLQQTIDERHEMENALYHAKCKANKCKMKIEREIQERERDKKITLGIIAFVILSVTTIIYLNKVTENNIKKCVESGHSQELCRAKLGR